MAPASSAAGANVSTQDPLDEAMRLHRERPTVRDHDPNASRPRSRMRARMQQIDLDFEHRLESTG
jgi:hypothetical protein